MVRILSASVFLLFWAQGTAAPFPKEVRIYDFSTTNRWDRPRLNRLQIIEAAPPRFQTVDSATELNFDLKSLKEGFKPASKLPGLERRSLLTMLRNGYITRELFDEVQKLPPKVGPRQVLYFQVCSILTLEEARATFEKIPWERVTGELPQSDAPFSEDLVFQRDRLWPPDKPLCISEASLMMVRGQESDPVSATHFPSPLPWQLGAAEPLGSLPPLEIDTIDRTKHHLVWEIKRAHAEDEGPIRGNLSLALLPALRMAWEEARIFGADSRESLVFIETLSTRLRRYFTRQFGMALWGNQSEAAERAVSFVSLEDLNKRFSFANLSERDTRLASLSEGILSPQSARALLEFDHLGHFSSFRVSPQQSPIQVWDHTPLAKTALTEDLFSLGVRTDPVAKAMLDYMQSLGQNYLWVFTESWLNEYGFVIPEDQPQPEEWKGLDIRVDNLDPEAVREGGTPFLAKLILKIYRFYWEKYQNSSLLVKHNWQLMFEQLGIESEATPDALLKLFPLRIVSPNPEITQDLVSLGGQAVRAWDAIGEGVASTAVNKNTYSVVAFYPEAVARLKERFSEGLFLENTCVADLERLSRLQFSGLF